MNGLNFDVSLMMNFIHQRDLPDQPEFRDLWDEGAMKPEIEDVKIIKNPRPDRIPQKGETDTKKKSSKKEKKNK